MKTTDTAEATLKHRNHPLSQLELYEQIFSVENHQGIRKTRVRLSRHDERSVTNLWSEKHAQPAYTTDLNATA
ncbi:MAG: hypothetical protein K6T73_08590 [Candidatus Bathyarchaeota archaeon]|nr:hypothetical protein [Candidatus Bathyarchaeota archaeon]